MRRWLTDDEDEHSCVASVGIWCSYADEISDCNRNAAPNNERSTFSESVGEVDLDNERDGTKDEDRDRHVVDSKGGKSIPG